MILSFRIIPKRICCHKSRGAGRRRISAPRMQPGQRRRNKSFPVLFIGCSMLLTDCSFLDLIAASLVPVGSLLCAMLDANSVINNSVPASLCLQVFLVCTMLDADTIVFDLIATSLVAAFFHHPAVIARIHLYHRPSVYRTPLTSIYRN